MNKLEFFILLILSGNGATGVINSMTVREILAAEAIQEKEYSTYFKHVKKLIEKGYINSGPKMRMSATFYITKLGIQKLKEAKENEE